jgi:hypothetical protein
MPGKPTKKKKAAKKKAAPVPGHSRARRADNDVWKPRADVAALGGRPTLYSDALGDRICMWIAAGMPIAASCAHEGIGRATFYDWRSRGALGVEPFATFLRAVEVALARSEVAVMQSVVAAAREDWKAGAWWLERRFPKRYGQRQQLKIEKAPAEMTDAELDAAIAQHGYVRAASLTDDEPEPKS